MSESEVSNWRHHNEAYNRLETARADEPGATYTLNEFPGQRWHVSVNNNQRIYVVEAPTAADACMRAATVTGDSAWLAGVELSTAWFLGDNDAKIPLLDERTGGGCDGLSRNSRSRNQGAESTLAMISVLQLGRRLSPAPR